MTCDEFYIIFEMKNAFMMLNEMMNMPMPPCVRPNFHYTRICALITL